MDGGEITKIHHRVTEITEVRRENAPKNENAQK
jgi:hypothetical protein